MSRTLKKDKELLSSIKKVLTLIHSGMQQKEIIKKNIINHIYVTDIFWGLKELNIIMITGYGRSLSYKWVEKRKCGNLAALSILHIIKMRVSIRKYRYRLKRENGQ